MTNTRRAILYWAEQGHIAQPDISRALALAEVLPSRGAWRHFLDQLLLWMGLILVASGLIFFLAYNWNDLGRYAKFALAEVLLVAALLFVWRLGLDRTSGKAALFGACILLGALLALIGQTYQTGADTFELFGIWAAMILPWVLVGRSTSLWLLWLILINVAITLYFQTFPGIFGILFNTERVLWVLFAFNSAALLVWEIVAARGVEWLSQRWEPRLLASASGGFVTALVIAQILDTHDAGIWAAPAWFVWLTIAWAVYRRYIKDVFMLAGGVLSVIVVVATFFGKHVSNNNAGGFLLVGLIVIVLSAAGGWWLKNLAAEDEQ